MKRRRGRGVIAGLLVALGCTYDYDKFSSPDEPGPSGSGGISGGAAGAAGSGASSGSGALGSGASLGSAGAVGSGASLGSGGAFGSAGLDAGAGAGSGGTNPCGAGEKPCAAGCVRDDDPAIGCAAASCDPCSTVNSLPVCQAGACAVGSCTSGFGDCAGGAADGCEQDIGTANHCGGCDNDCTAQGAAGGFSCESRRCGCTSDEQCIVGAGPGNATCNTTNRTCVCEAIECRPGEACERQGVGRRCRCNGGNACGPNQVCCREPAGCRSLETDELNCGACGNACPAGFVCREGLCSCDADADCNAGSPGSCVADTSCDSSPCGPARCSCGGTRCAVGQRCFSGDRCG